MVHLSPSYVDATESSLQLCSHSVSGLSSNQSRVGSMTHQGLDKTNEIESCLEGGIGTERHRNDICIKSIVWGSTLTDK